MPRGSLRLVIALPCVACRPPLLSGVRGRLVAVVVGDRLGLRCRNHFRSSSTCRAYCRLSRRVWRVPACAGMTRSAELTRALAHHQARRTHPSHNALVSVLRIRRQSTSRVVILEPRAPGVEVVRPSSVESIASIRMQWTSVTTHVSARKRAGSSIHCGSALPCSMAMCSTVAASSASHRVCVSAGARFRTPSCSAGVSA